MKRVAFSLGCLFVSFQQQTKKIEKKNGLKKKKEKIRFLMYGD
jgi:hypothetical protein